MVSQWTKEKNVDDIVEVLLQKSIPAAPINDVPRIVTDPHIAAAREMFVDVKTPNGDMMKVVACPIKFSETKARILTPPPKLGEHTDAILSEFLGLDKDDISVLKQKGALG
jgi:formyl-CoA transferase